MSRKRKESVISGKQLLEEHRCILCGTEMEMVTPTWDEAFRYECKTCNIAVQVWEEVKPSAKQKRKAVRKAPTKVRTTKTKNSKKQIKKSKKV